MRHATLLLLLFFCRYPAAAEDAANIDPGARVRVSTRTVNDRVGLVEEVTADALRIRFDDEALPTNVPLADVTQLEMSLGERSRGQAVWGKAKWGALFGAVPGAISLGLQHEQVGENGSSVGRAMALGAWSGGLLGGLIGATIGALHPGEKWERVSPSFRIHPKERGGGFSFAATVEF